MLLHEIHFSAISFFCVVAQDNLTKTDQYLLKTNWCVGAKIILNRFLLFWLQRLGRSENFSRQIFFSLINSDFKISYTFVSLIVGWKRSFSFTSNTLNPITGSKNIISCANCYHPRQQLEMGYTDHCEIENIKQFYSGLRITILG